MIKNTKQGIYIFLFSFLVYLFLSNIFSTNIESFENSSSSGSSCQDDFDIKSAVASNKGTIESLKEQVNTMMKNVQQLMAVSTLEKENASKLNELEDNVEKMKNTVSLNSKAVTALTKGKADSIRSKLSLKK